MKRILSILFLFTTLLTATAIPPITDYLPMRQSDGSALMVRRYGQWRTEFYATRDGLVLVRSQLKGDLCYARLHGGQLVSSEVVAHEAPARSEAEKAHIAAGTVSLSQALATIKPLRLHKAGERRTIVASTDDGLGKYGTSGEGAVKSLGDVIIPVIMTEFSDKKFNEATTIEKMERFYNEEGYADESGCVGSVRDYFIAQSGGMFRPTFQVVAKVTLSKTVAHYGSNDNQRGFIEVVNDAMNAATKQGVVWKDYIQQGNGIPLVSVLYAGEGEATGGGEDTLWPCEADVNTTMAGVRVNSIFIGNELFHDNTLMGMGVFCHEFGHALGLPDFYCTNYGHNAVTMGQWSIMCSGCYLPDNHARAPIGYTAYERSYLGWQDIVEPAGADAVTLYPFGSEDGPNAMLLRNDDDEREYFILEQRQPGTWYPDKFGNGLFVTHVTYDRNSWYYNILNNTQNALRMTYLSATGTCAGGNAAELFPGANNTKQTLSRTSNPALRLFDGTTLDKPVFKITRNSDKTISLNYLQEEISRHEPGELLERDGLTFRFATRSSVEVAAPQAGKYSGNITVPSSFTEDIHTFKVTGIAADAFANCPDLASVSLPASIKSVADGAFAGSPKLKSINVAEDNAHYLSLGGALFSNSLMVTNPEEAAKEVEGISLFDFQTNPWMLEAATNRLKFDAGVVEMDIIEDDITMTCTATDENGKVLVYMLKTGDDTFEFNVRKGGSITLTTPENVRLTSLTFTSPSLNLTPSVGTLTGATWEGSTHQLTLTATSNTRMTYIAAQTYTHPAYPQAELYSYPAGLTASAYTVPAGIARIAPQAFEGTTLTSLTLSDSLKTLGTAALNIPTLTSLTARSTTPAACEGDPFTLINKTACRLVVPTGSEAAYRAAAYWQQFFDPTAINAPAVSEPQNTPAYYDLYGRRIARPSSGIYLTNGKKVLNVKH